MFQLDVISVNGVQYDVQLRRLPGSCGEASPGGILLGIVPQYMYTEE